MYINTPYKKILGVAVCRGGKFNLICTVWFITEIFFLLRLDFGASRNDDIKHRFTYLETGCLENWRLEK